MSSPRSLIFAAFLVACLGVAFFSVMDAAMKGIALAIGAYNALLWRNVAGVVVSGGAYAVARSGWPSAAVLRLHIWRGVIVAAMALLFFWSVTILPLAEAIALSFIAPLIALYLAAMLLGETIGRATIIASLLGITGVGVIMAGRLGGAAGHSEDALWGVAAVLASAVLFAYNLVLARQQAQLAKPSEIAFFQTLTILVALGFAAPWLAVMPAAEHWPLIIGAALLAVTSLHLLSWAYARAEAQVLIPVEYTAFIWAALCGWMFFDEALSWPVIGGAILIVSGCLIAARAKPQPAQVEEIFA
ncbi:MAG: DMT family transporter [Pseudomonadota bacterium]